MIKRLKRRFVFVNMCILTFVLLSILCSTFALMYSSEVKLSYEIMESLMSQKLLEQGENQDDLTANNDVVLEISLMNNTYNENPWGNEEWYNTNDNLPVFTDKYQNEYDNYPPERPDNNNFQPDNPQFTRPSMIYPSEDAKPTQTTVVSSTTEVGKSTNKSLQSDVKTDINQDFTDNKSDDKLTKKTYKNDKPVEKDNSLTNDSQNNTVPSAPEINEEFSRPELKPEEPFGRKTEPDPFKGKVKRSYVYMEFEDIKDIEDSIYQYYTSENDIEVKKAAAQIYNDNDEHGKITIGNNKYRYMFRYDSMKNAYSIVMLDRTLEINTINRLLFIFIIIAGAALLLIFFISVILANWTIKPVAKAWTQQKEFIANASHELKTPLTVISTNTDVVLSNPEDTVENQAKWLNYIKNETFRMSKLVNNLLCIAKYDANRIDTIYSKVDLSDIVSGICLQYEPLAFENRKTLITDIDDNLQVLGDEDKLKQVVNILMDNALKYSTDNGTIKISLKKVKQSSVCMTVSNSSENIDKEHLDKLFDRFYRVDSSRNRKTGGSGLGLNIAKTIVENHKGTISVINKDNITSFIVTF